MRYLLTTSQGEKLELTQTDYDKFVQFSASGNFIKLSRGVVNPSFVVAIVPIGRETPKYQPLPPAIRQGKIISVKGLRPEFLKKVLKVDI